MATSWSRSSRRMPASYAVRVRPYDGREPAGKYRFQVTAWRDARATSEMLHGRELARDSATRWLAARSATIPSNAIVPVDGPLPPLDAARVPGTRHRDRRSESRKSRVWRPPAVNDAPPRFSGMASVSLQSRPARADWICQRFVAGKQSRKAASPRPSKEDGLGVVLSAILSRGWEAVEFSSFP